MSGKKRQSSNNTTSCRSVVLVAKVKQGQSIRRHSTVSRQNSRKVDHHSRGDKKERSVHHNRCKKCGKGWHPSPDKYPEGVTCYCCHKIGQYGSCCLSKSLSTLEVHEDSETDEQDCDQEAFLGAIGRNQSSKAWMKKINTHRD